MYAQITVTSKHDSGKLRQALIDQVGVGTLPILKMLQQTTHAEAAEAIAPTVVAGQLLRDAAVVLYFFDGPDTVLVHIKARTVTELKAQAKRVTRQMITTSCVGDS